MEQDSKGQAKGALMKSLDNALTLLEQFTPEASAWVGRVFAESGLPGFAVDTWFGLFAPAGTPAETVQRLNQLFVTALQSPEVRQRFSAFMAEPAPTTPAQFADFVRAELAKYEKVVKASGAKID